MSEKFPGFRFEVRTVHTDEILIGIWEKPMHDPLVRNAMDVLENLCLQIILCGPPGTSKTWQAKRLAAELLGFPADQAHEDPKEDCQEFAAKRFSRILNSPVAENILETWKSGAWEIVQFHPSYNYEDFVRGIRVRSTSDQKGVLYFTEDRILAQMCTHAKRAMDEAISQGREETEAPRFVLIIDEINRANLASVLGELIYALEYRGREVMIPYSKDDDGKADEKEGSSRDTLAIPRNLFVIGTMNTADRSIGHIDYAIRRRFAFIHCPPAPGVIRDYYKRNSVDFQERALDLFGEVARLFEPPSGEDGQGGLLSTEFHGADVQIGHTYFLAKKKEELAYKFAYQVYPILREYAKDGILVSPDSSLDAEVPANSGVKIFRQIDQRTVYENILRFLGPSKSSSESKG